MESLEPTRANLIGDVIYLYLMYKNMSDEERVIMTGQLTRAINRAPIKDSKRAYAFRALVQLHRDIDVIKQNYSWKHHDGVDRAFFLEKIKRYASTLGVNLPNLSIIVTI